MQVDLTLLSRAHLTLKFQEEAFTTSVYLINRLSSLKRLDDTSPLYTLFKTSPDYTFLKVFGCSCIPLLVHFNRHKLQFKSTECVFWVIAPKIKGASALTNMEKYISLEISDLMNCPSLIRHGKTMIPRPLSHNIVRFFLLLFLPC